MLADLFAIAPSMLEIVMVDPSAEARFTLVRKWNAIKLLKPANGVLWVTSFVVKVGTTISSGSVPFTTPSTS